MGIKDLLRFMKPYIAPVHISKFAGKRVGIDAYSWLHKGAYSCSMELCLDLDSDKKLRYIDYFMHRINLLRHHNIIPVVVFDGGNIPCKASTEQDRHRRRKANCDLAMAKLKEGNVGAASELFQRAVSVTPTMAHKLIQILRSESIEFVVAPYEADAQLAYLSALEADKGGISAVITEDSDLVAYGCPTIVFKMDRYGNGEEIMLDNVFNSVTATPSFRKFEQQLFTGMCVLAGCDFLPSVPGIGIAKAYALVSKYRNLERALSILKLEKQSQMPEDYSKSFREAVAVFQHAQIYDANMKKLKHMRPIPEELLQSLDRELDFLGPSQIRKIPPSVATAIAEGKMDPISMEAFDHSSISRCLPNPGRIKIYAQPPRSSYATSVSVQESSFVAFSPHRTRGTKNKTGKSRSSNTTGTEKKHNLVPGERFLSKVEKLQKLVEPSVIHETVENKVAPNGSLKVPENNPFKRKEYDEIHSNITESGGLVETQTESSETLCVPPDYEDSEVGKDEYSRKRKLNENSLHQKDTTSSEQVSEVTQEENLDIVLSVNSNSQEESLSSRPSKLTHEKKRKSGKLEISSCNKSDSKVNSILNFFSRV